MDTTVLNGRPWDRREGESEPAYIAFLVYRNLGPSRSIDRAYRQFKQGKCERTAVPRRTSAPGNWGDYSVRFDWVQRARAWDIWRLQVYGQRVAVLLTHNLERSLERLADALDRYGLGDPEWSQILDTFGVLNQSGGLTELCLHDSNGAGRTA